MSDKSEVIRTIKELLVIAKVAMPEELYAIDPRILRAEDLVAELENASSSTAWFTAYIRRWPQAAVQDLVRDTFRECLETVDQVIALPTIITHFVPANVRHRSAAGLSSFVPTCPRASTSSRQNSTVRRGVS